MRILTATGSLAAQRSTDHDFAFECLANVLAEAMLLVDDVVMHAGRTRVKHVEKRGQRFTFDFDLSLPPV